MMIIAMILSAVVVGIFWHGYARRNVAGVIGTFAVGLVMALFTCASPVVWIQFFALVVAMGICWGARVPEKWFVACAVAVTLAIYVGAALEFLSTYRTYEAWREKNRPISVAERLSYEPKQDHPASAAADVAVGNNERLQAVHFDEPAATERKLRVTADVERVENRL